MNFEKISPESEEYKEARERFKEGRIEHREFSVLIWGNQTLMEIELAKTFQTKKTAGKLHMLLTRDQDYLRKIAKEYDPDYSLKSFETLTMLIKR